jgi:hydroxymethylpyrimidine pyrophosphatase-like HAD family hydrolase
MSKIAIDFDSTLCDKEWKPIKDSQVAVSLLQESGHVLYICTSRKSKHWPKMRRWLKENDFPLLRITNKKELETVAYIDDRAIRFTNWNDIRKYFI